MRPRFCALSQFYNFCQEACSHCQLICDPVISLKKHSMTAQLRTWIDDSRVSHLDEGTKNMIAEMKKDAARHRWRRLLLSIRLSYKLNEGKRPDFENLVVVPPGCDGTKKRSLTIPKYFQEGTVMNTLIESGIEVVWFSDMTQCDVVYGICVQRQQRKVTVVFRGTVRLIYYGRFHACTCRVL